MYADSQLDIALEIQAFKDVIKGSYGLFIYLFIQIGTGLVFANQLKGGSYTFINIILILQNQSAFHYNLQYICFLCIYM